MGGFKVLILLMDMTADLTLGMIVTVDHTPDRRKIQRVDHIQITLILMATKALPIVHTVVACQEELVLIKGP